MALEVNTAIKSPGIFVVAPTGSIDGADRGMLQEKIDSVLKQNPDVIIFDMEHADYINSLGIRILVKTKNAMKQRGGKIAFINLQPQPSPRDGAHRVNRARAFPLPSRLRSLEPFA